MSKKKAQPAQTVPPLPTQQPENHTVVPDFFQNFWLLAGILVAATAATYWASLSNGFMVFDDDKAIRYNQIIKNPTLAGIFGSNNLGMYAPVTWLGYALVYALAGESASAFHTFSLLLHIGCVVTVFQLLNSLKIKREVSFFTALLFALHPMQVEATSWIAGQSALTFSLFYLLALLAYVRWQDTARPLFYGLTLLAFMASILAKSAAVTLPLLLLALDWYKTGRVTMKNVLGKLPFFAASLAFGLYTFATREAEGHNLVVASKAYSLFDRFLMVCHSLLFYPYKLLIPFNLSIFYPMEKTDGAWSIDYYLAPLAVAGLAWFAWKQAQKIREIGLGSLWYFLPLTVMLPYVSVGTFEMRSDRYIYVSSAGFLFLVVWLAQKLEPNLRRGILAAAAGGLAVLTFFQTQNWKNEVAAFKNCVDKYPNAPLCNCNLAYGELLNFDFENSAKHYTQTLALDPGYVEAYNGRGQAYFELRKFPEAFSDFDKAIKAGIVTPKLFLNRGKCHVILNRPAEAIPDLTRSLELEPRNPDTYYFLAVAQGKTGDVVNSLKNYSKAIELRPDYIEALVNRGLIYYNSFRYDEAIADYTAAIAAKPDVAIAFNNRANAYLKTGQKDKALADVTRAIQLQPNNVKNYETRAAVFSALGMTTEMESDLLRISKMQGGK